MELKINVITNNTCKVYVQDLTTYRQDNDGLGDFNNFYLQDTISVDLLIQNKLQEDITKEIIISNHEDSLVQIPVTIDGVFSIVHYVLPTKEWFDREFQKPSKGEISHYDIVYYSDGENFYKYIDSTSEIVPFEEILNLNLNAAKYTVYNVEKKYVSICFLRKCYINLCQQIFNNKMFSSCWSKSNVDSELIFKRDFAWMAINVIKYLTECEQLEEVQRIIENIQSCNGICPQNLKSNGNGCGCS